MTEDRLYVDFNRRDPHRPELLFASLHRLGDRRLGDRVRVTDHEQFDLYATIAALNHAAGEIILLRDGETDLTLDQPAGPWYGNTTTGTWNIRAEGTTEEMR